jgi:hypothetical protein
MQTETDVCRLLRVADVKAEQLVAEALESRRRGTSRCCKPVPGNDCEDVTTDTTSVRV